MARISHRGCNNILSVIVISVSLYTLLLPLWPAFQFWWDSRNPVVRDSISRQVYADTSDEDEPIKGNRLLIPDILVDEPIVTGNSLSIIDDGGIWLRPASVLPEEDGNIVLAGHRFTYNQPNGPLYNLDKLSYGDVIGLHWEGEMHRFEVSDIKTVTPDSIGIEAPTDQRQLTLYTCTPLITAENRLVIIAQEVE